VGLDASPQGGKCPSEGDRAPILGFVPHLAPAAVIAVLLAAARIATGRLEMAVGRRTNPNVLVCRGDRERRDALEFGAIANRLPVGIEVCEALSYAFT